MRSPEDGTIGVDVDVPADNLRDNTHSVLVPGLTPLRRYTYRVARTADGQPLGGGSFETAPADHDATPGTFSFAFMSCHQPFNSPDGTLSERAMRMLRLAPAVLRRHDAKFAIVCGDQIYADAPGTYSLFDPHYTNTKVHPGGGSILDWPAADVRRAYHQHYRTYWAMTQIRHLYANYPSYPILDDHEILDDWGSDPNHLTPRYADLRAGALRAYWDYQGSRVGAPADAPPPSLHYSFDYGNVAVFVMDIRSERDITAGRLYGDQQLADLQAFLAAHTEAAGWRALFLVVSVPVFHMPEWLADVGAAVVGGKVDFPDHWAHRPNRPARDRLLELLFRHQEQNPLQRLAILSGDVHIGVGFAVHWKGGSKPILYQLTSSAISNRLKRPEAFFSKIAPGLEQPIDCDWDGSARVRLLGTKGEETPPHNPFGGLNVGIVEVRDRGDHSTIRFKLVGYPAGHELEDADMFDSGEL
ncbi:MAG: alkaline phosphatase family protein [Deltaproteobacteria bacterium]|nr:alkaline phosphatase family protein [Deltaproteobacteria bacterium]